MKKMLKLTALVLTLAMCFALLTACGGKDETMTDLEYIKDKGKLIVGMTDYAPMNFKAEDGSWTGFDTEFALKIGEKLGVEVEFIEIQWNNKIFELDSKAIDCVWNGMTLTDEVLAGMNCTEPYVVNAQVVVMAKDKLDQYADAASMKDLKFSVEAGSAGEACGTDAGFTMTAVDTQAKALMEVQAGAADACIIDITMANAMTGEDTSYTELGYKVSLSEEFYGIGFRKESDATAEVNKLIEGLIADGWLQALATKYDLTLAD